MRKRDLLLVLAAPAFAATSLVAAEAPLTVRCGILLDPATRSSKANVEIFLEGGKVARLAPSGAPPAPPPSSPSKKSPGAVPASAEGASKNEGVLDLSSYTCVPGFIDAHTHLLLQGDATSAEYDEQMLLESGPYRALRAARAATIALDHGFTTVRDLGTEGAGFSDVDLKRAFDKGILQGPRVFTSGPAMSVTGGYPLLGYSWERKMPDGVLKCDGPDDCRRAVRFQVQNGVDWIKVYADRSYYRTPDGGWAAIANFTPEEMKAIVEEAHKLRKKVAAHSMTPSGHRVALSAGVDSLEHGDVLDDETVKAMVARKVAYCPTITVADFVRGPRSKTNPIWDQLWAASQDSFKRAYKAGVPIAFGTDAGGFDWDKRNQAEEFSFMVAWGMTPWDALRSATVVAADLLGPQNEVKLGCLDAGCVADLVAVAGNPLTDIKVTEKTVAVVSRGKVVKRPD
ncbi:MAG TPA: amidohydrolase family protein [Thermoanaerobaculia bacterium]|nr:amidohydrolase family protein [Thermoanaerobaculia bacterium]